MRHRRMAGHGAVEDSKICMRCITYIYSAAGAGSHALITLMFTFSFLLLLLHLYLSADVNSYCLYGILYCIGVYSDTHL